MFRVIITSRAEKEFAKLPQNLKQKFYTEFEKLAVNPFIHPRVKNFKGLKLAIASASAGGEFYLPYFQKKKELKLLIFF